MNVPTVRNGSIGGAVRRDAGGNAGRDIRLDARSDGTATLAGLLAHGERDAADQAQIRRLVRHGAIALVLVAAALSAWSVTAPLAGAVIAPALVKVELNRKTVQHQEGGIVREIRVRDGQKVRAGDVLLVVGDVRNDAELGLNQDLRDAALARKARASAEAALQPRFEPDLSGIARGAADGANPGAHEHLLRERALFVARRRALDDQVASLHAQIRQVQAQAAALDARIEATEASARLSDEELEVNDKLVQQGFVNRTRLLALQRASADYRARVAEFRGELAAVRQRIGELQARVAQARNQYQNQATDELKDAAARVRELEQRLRPSRDQVERQFVRAPVDGTVLGLRVAALGEAIGPRELLLEVVPEHEKLVFEARVRPEDIEHVTHGATAEVRLAGLDTSLRPLAGAVTSVSADRVSKPGTNESWYVATVEVDAAGVHNRPEIRLVPGMPAEVYVATAARSLSEYLLKPLATFNRRALREP